MIPLSDIRRDSDTELNSGRKCWQARGRVGEEFPLYRPI